MTVNRRFLFLGLILTILLLTACCSDSGGLVPDPDGDDSGEEGNVEPPKGYDPAAEGEAMVHYHYLMKHPDIEFNLEPVIPISFSEDSPGVWSAGGINEYTVDFRMDAGAGGMRCNVFCQVILRFSIDGEVQLDPNTGACTLPMKFVFQPQADEWIMETTCPPEAEAFFNCADLSLLLADPSVYTFTKSKRDVKLPSDPGVTRRAELKNARMPAGLQGVCDW